jgi:hypothetical protein
MMLGLGLNSANSALFNYWGGSHSLHAGIRDCNTFLENIESVGDLNRYEKDRVIAEVKLAKAYMHFYLLCEYGPICPLRESIPVGAPSIRPYREKIDDCFAYIIQLLDEIIQSDALPAVIDARGTQLGRFVRSAAYMLKAKALVYWASPLFNGNTDYVRFLDHKGEPFFNQTEDPTRWKNAADACLTAIDICNEDGIRLYQKTDYLTLKTLSDTTLLVNTLRSSFSERWNVELIWGNTSSNMTDDFQRAAVAKLASSTNNPSGILSVPFSTVELFYSNNGVPIEEDKDWATSGKYSDRFNQRVGDEANKYYIQKGEQTAAMNFDREPRFYATLGFDRGKWYGNHFQSTPDDDSQTLFPKGRWGEISSQAVQGNYNVTGYWPKKIVSLLTLYTSQNEFFTGRYAYPAMRFSDLLLLTAEALNESKSAPDSEVYQYIDMIRARAGLEGVVDSWNKYALNSNKPVTKAGMREIIQRERKIELACEGHYYWDSHRWKTAITEQNRQIQGWTVTASSADIYYTVNTINTQKITVRDYFAPIPESDMIKNPNLIQNPGW